MLCPDYSAVAYGIELEVLDTLENVSRIIRIDRRSSPSASLFWLGIGEIEYPFCPWLILVGCWTVVADY